MSEIYQDFASTPHFKYFNKLKENGADQATLLSLISHYIFALTVKNIEEFHREILESSPFTTILIMQCKWKAISEDLQQYCDFPAGVIQAKIYELMEEAGGDMQKLYDDAIVLLSPAEQENEHE